MPTYDYRCESCGHEFELFQPINSKPRRTCPSCGARRARRLIGAGSGIIFKGSGFYQTDYRSEHYRRRAKEDRPPAAGDGAGDKKSAGKTTATAERKE